MKPIFPVISLSLLWLTCADLDRNNPLDPKNAGSYVDQAIVAELFVNDSTGYDYCNYALEAIEKISQQAEFNQQLLVLEYHVINKASQHNDPYALEACNQRYYEYVPNTNERGIPDAMFNGSATRVQGASHEQIELRYTEAARSLLGKESYFGIEGSKKLINNSVQLKFWLARYSSSWEGEATLVVVLYEDLGIPRYRHVVRKILPLETITRMKQGEVLSFTLTEALEQFSYPDNIFAIVMLQRRNHPAKEIYQVAKL
ncbi:MAG: hypothetical protein ONB16_04060 [candidate division KSB1 bacterium]|nr:hypothetical protein [candidate division KSB1 bacterium]MDZ7341454.1 hypothetical protein [candidate division KSB1 bacterium]